MVAAAVPERVARVVKGPGAVPRAGAIRAASDPAAGAWVAPRPGEVGQLAGAVLLLPDQVDLAAVAASLGRAVSVVR